MKRVLTVAFAVMAFATTQAQTETSYKPFSTLDGGITLGTTGIGFEATTPLGKDWDVRAGFDFWPHINHDMHFNVRVGEDEGSEEENTSKFQRMASTLKSMTGYNVDDQVTMEAHPTMWNFKVLVDFKPFNNKNWHVTAGFYWGNSQIAYAENSKEDMTSLFAVGMYNHMYECAVNDEPYATLNDANGNPTDLYLPTQISTRLINNGRMGVHVGTYKRDITDENGNVIHKAGDPYNMEPDENSMVSASVKVNKFKPYLGFGYMGKLSNKDPRWKVGFDVGAMFWGGTPSMKTHDGTDLIKDVTDLRHGVKRYRNLINAMKVMPVVNFRITRTIF